MLWYDIQKIVWRLKEFFFNDGSVRHEIWLYEVWDILLTSYWFVGAFIKITIFGSIDEHLTNYGIQRKETSTNNCDKRCQFYQRIFWNLDCYTCALPHESGRIWSLSFWLILDLQSSVKANGRWMLLWKLNLPSSKQWEWSGWQVHLRISILDVQFPQLMWEQEDRDKWSGWRESKKMETSGSWSKHPETQIFHSGREKIKSKMQVGGEANTQRHKGKNVYWCNTRFKKAAEEPKWRPQHQDGRHTRWPETQDDSRGIQEKMWSGASPNEWGWRPENVDDGSRTRWWCHN